MSEPPSERRLTENEVVFRKANQQVQSQLASLQNSDRSEGISSLVSDEPIYFYCECSNEKCRERIKLRPSKSKELHRNSSRFFLLPGHNVPSIERIIMSTPEYIVVEKFMTPPPDTGELDVTITDNT